MEVVDKNIEFFHTTTLKHMAANKIKYLKTVNGKVGKYQDIKSEMVGYFSYLLKEDLNLNEIYQDG